ISDIRDSNLYKELKQQLPETFTLNYNTDGAPIFKSSKQSFWPQQLVINELPLKERFKHIIYLGEFF
ncbi:GSCOCG00013587001-RA-CDS, partial [Cotesia congregata]